MFGDIPDDKQDAIIRDVCDKFGQTAQDESEWMYDRSGRMTVELTPGIPEEQADEATEFADELAKKYGVLSCYPSEIGS